MIYLLTILLVVSVAINYILIDYIKIRINSLIHAAEGASYIFVILSVYLEHITSLYQLEQYYGDQDIKSVIKHTKGVVNALTRYKEIVSFLQPEVETLIEETEEFIENDETLQKI